VVAADRHQLVVSGGGFGAVAVTGHEDNRGCPPATQLLKGQLRTQVTWGGSLR
jgi:hypothetical protein